ncbi:DUF4912 domain-containing protein [Anaeromyxobacter sp. Fw109-5]|uniref:DUF4912 domain-containing protein n=1 Tax=Anaeromyxobacter sp. (strain Fw109-5) TaxID=404589 RepID=UPI000158A524|nr:DUF4912 domain-containing protein [Anaeromyxobacter sp. Fw109-5]ABS25322.1 conserved hypothetical protein [Anaeromyxobacter sp. Fw109-5]
MADLRKMTVESLRELARKVLGPGQSRKTKKELVAALEAAERKAAPEAKRTTGAKARAAASRAAETTGKAVRAAKKAGKAAKEGARAAARASKTAAASVSGGMRDAAKGVRPPKAKVAKVAAAIAGAAAGAAAGAMAGVAAGVSAARARRRKIGNGKPGGIAPDPEGYFVARVRGEEAVREAPYPMTETTADVPEAFRAVELAEEGFEGGEVYEEQLGELPWGYGDDAFVALPRDPRTLFLYWDFAQETARGAFAGLEHPRVELRVFARDGGGWEPVRTVEFALESRGYYVHDLTPGRVYRAEIHAVDRRGQQRQLGRGSNEMMLPPLGPSAVIDDRFIRIPWEVPLGRLLGPGHAGGPFSAEARALLARLSDWSRFAGRPGGGSAGGVGGRPTSPAVSSPSSPFGGFGPGEGA